jgi:hypothetical protein
VIGAARRRSFFSEALRLEHIEISVSNFLGHNAVDFLQAVVKLLIAFAVRPQKGNHFLLEFKFMQIKCCILTD